MDRRSWLMLLSLAAIWGASYLLIKIGVRDMSPAVVAWGRIALAAAVLLPFAAAQGGLAGLGRRNGWLALVAATQVAGPFLLISAGEEEIASSLAGILVSSTPLFTALLAVWVDHEERSQGLRMVGVLIGLGGVTALLGLDLSGSAAELLGGLAVVLASLGYAVGGLLVKHKLATPSPIGVAAAVMAWSAALLAPLALLTMPAEAPGAGPLGAVVALGVVGTGIAFAIFYTLIARVGPARSMLVTYIAPAFAVIYGAALLDEPVTAATIAGITLIVGGSWLAAEGRRPGARPAPEEVPPRPSAEVATTDVYG